MVESNLNELSTVIGELRNFAAQQVATNTHMLQELKKIGEKMETFSEVGAGLKEYRNVLHERFNRIHELFAEQDERLDKLELASERMDRVITSWKAYFSAGMVACTILSSLLSAYGGAVLRALVVVHPG